MLILRKADFESFPKQLRWAIMRLHVHWRIAEAYESDNGAYARIIIDTGAVFEFDDWGRGDWRLRKLSPESERLYAVACEAKPFTITEEPESSTNLQNPPDLG